MIKEKLEKKEDFTNSEKQIADFILKHPEEFAESKAEELAKKTFTSKASVIRFAKKMAPKGYRSFQTTLLKEINEIDQAEKKLEEHVIGKDSHVRDLLAAVPNLYESSIYRTKSRLNLSQLERAIRILKQSDVIEIYGTGITESLAREMEFKLQSIGYHAVALSGLNEHALKATNERHKTAILLTFTGGNPEMTYISKELNKYHYNLIGIGGYDKDWIKKNVQEYIEVDSEETVLSMEAITEGTSIRYVLDVLFASLMIDNYDANAKVSMELLLAKDAEK